MPIMPDATLLAAGRMIKLTQQRELSPYVWCIRTKRDDWLFGLLSLRPRRFLSTFSHHLIIFRRAAARRCICRQAAHPMRHVRDAFAGSPTARAGRQGKACKAQQSRFDRSRSLRRQPSSRDQPPVSHRRDCRSAGQALDARGPICLFRESLRVQSRSPCRRKKHWLCAKQRSGRHRHGTAANGHYFRCGKLLARVRHLEALQGTIDRDPDSFPSTGG